jgi:hypothetical protein
VFHHAAVRARHTEVFQAHALAVEHPEYIVIRNEQQRRRVAEGGVIGEPLWVGVSMRTDDGQMTRQRVQAPRDCTLRGLGGKQPIRM